MNRSSSTIGPDALGYYAILGLAPDADDALIKQNYRDAAKKWHPDYNSGEEAKENFQKVSVAYDILQDKEKRLTYDLLCSAYSKDKFPAMFSLKVYKNRAGQEDINVRAVSLRQIIGKIIDESDIKNDEVCNYPEALKTVFKTSLFNWLLGWWSVKALFLNPQAIIANYQNIGCNHKENYQLLVHNALAYYQNGDKDKAFMSAVQAGNFADSRRRELLKKLMDMLAVRPQLKLKPWNYLNLRLIQLIIPVLLLLLALIPFSYKVVSDSDLWDYFDKKKEISYHQEVRMYGGSMADDMVVAKIINIPVDTQDMSKLYHLKKELEIMHGPADDFDVMRRLKAGTTVRLTGVSPDDIWARIMLDEGDMGFIRLEYLKKGIGTEIPFGSKIVEK